jgi:hypothetical protein
MAVGTWADLEYRRGQLDGESTEPIGLVKEFTASADLATIPTETVQNETGFLVGIEVVADETTPFDSLVVNFQSVDGISLYLAAAITASDRIEIDPAVPFVGGYKLACSNNTTNSAKAKIICLVVSGD